MPEFVTPVINLNGNSIEALIEQYNAAWKAYRAAEDDFRVIDFHGRDYQTLPQELWLKAQEQHVATDRHFGEIRAYLEAHREALYGQQRERS